MIENNFVFADLSTFDEKVATNFYTQVFDWQFHTDGGYHLAHAKGKEICGLYETPAKFKAMNMPSFWMSYIRVEHVEETVEKARQLGGIIELVDLNQAIGKIALIRDPMGAGFTIYEGTALNSRYEDTANALVWNELFVSDFSRVKLFYEGILQWKFKAKQDNRYVILNSKEKEIGAIQEISNDIKGNKEYWAVYFGVEDIAQAKATVLSNKGTLLYEDESSTMLADPFGAFFYVAPIQKSSSSSLNPSAQTASFSWKAALGLLLIVISLVTNWSWIWGFFFAFWVYSDVKSGYTHLFEPIYKKTNPVMYWVIVFTWAALGALSVAYYSNL
jgi:predicted enzyme related to lactoylglutathione lyase